MSPANNVEAFAERAMRRGLCACVILLALVAACKRQAASGASSADHKVTELVYVASLKSAVPGRLTESVRMTETPDGFCIEGRAQRITGMGPTGASRSYVLGAKGEGGRQLGSYSSRIYYGRRRSAVGCLSAPGGGLHVMADCAHFELPCLLELQLPPHALVWEQDATVVCALAAVRDYNLEAGSTVELPAVLVRGAAVEASTLVLSRLPSRDGDVPGSLCVRIDAKGAPGSSQTVATAWLHSMKRDLLAVEIRALAMAGKMVTPECTFELLEGRMSAPSADDAAAPEQAGGDASVGAVPWRDVEVSFAGQTGVLAATLRVPKGSGPFPALIVRPTAGPVARNSLLSSELARAGYAVLAYDRRGYGESDGAVARATLEELGQDLAAAFGYLIRRPEIMRDRIGVIAIGRSADVAAAFASAQPGLKALALIAGAHPGPVFPVQHERQALSWVALPFGWPEQQKELFIQSSVRRCQSALAEERTTVCGAGLCTQIAHLEQLSRADQLHHLALCRADVLVVHPAKDEIVPLADVERMVKSASEDFGKTIQLQVLNSFGHYVGDSTGQCVLAPPVVEVLLKWLETGL